MLVVLKPEEEFLKAVLRRLDDQRATTATAWPIADCSRHVTTLANALGAVTTRQAALDACIKLAADAMRFAIDGSTNHTGFVPLRAGDIVEVPPDAARNLATLAKFCRKDIRLTASFSAWKKEREANPPADDETPITGWLAIIREPKTPRDPEHVYVCPTIWPDRYEAVKVYGNDKIVAFVPLNTFHGDK